MKWATLLGSKAVLEAENERLRRTLAEREARVFELLGALGDALNRESQPAPFEPHSQSVPERDRSGHIHTRYSPQLALRRGNSARSNTEPTLKSLEALAAAVPVGRDRRRSR